MRPAGRTHLEVKVLYTPGKGEVLAERQWCPPRGGIWRKPKRTRVWPTTAKASGTCWDRVRVWRPDRRLLGKRNRKRYG
jgi:hypothetical protein